MTLTYDEIIEAMAQAIWETNSAGVEWANISGTMQAIVYVEARAALSALRALAEERGYRLMVPCEATEDMDEAGTKEADIHDEWGVPKYVTNAPAVFRAMLASAPDPTKEPE